MMQQLTQTFRTVLVLTALATLAPRSAEAGFWDWLTHKDKKPACGPQGCGAPAPGYAACGPQGCGAYPYPAAAPVPYYTPPATRVGYAPNGYAPIGYANYLPQAAPSGYVSYGPAYGNVTQYPPLAQYPQTYAGYAPAYGTTANYAPQYATQVTYAAPAAQPFVANYAPATQPVVAGYAPTAAYAPTKPGCPSCGNQGCPSCGNQVRYVPQPYYRSTTTQMPVTAYRPVTSYDPATGQPVIVMKPCTAYECQVQQVRTPFTYAPAAAAPCTGPNCPQANYPTTYATVPAVTTPGPIATTPPPTTFTTPPGTTIIPGGARPATSFPSGSLAPTTDPASQVPSLGPEGVRSGANMIPVPQQPQQWPTANESPAPLYSKPASLPSDELKFKPVPDPEGPRTNAAPQLIDPRDKLTGADFLQKYKVATVDYPDAVTKPKPATQVQQIPTINRPSDEGWRSGK